MTRRPALAEPPAERERLRGEVEALRQKRALVRPLDQRFPRATGTTPLVIVSAGLSLVAGLMAWDASLVGRDPIGAALLGLISVSVAVLTLGWRFGGSLRLRRELRTLPFPVIGLLETLTDERLMGRVVIQLIFADSRARLDDVAALVRAKIPEVEGLRDTEVRPHPRGALLTVFLTEPARFALATWFLLLGRHVLRDLHGAWPLAHVEVCGESTSGRGLR